MAQGVAYRNGTVFYAINLASSTQNVSDTVTRVNWSCNVQFGNWFYWGLRLHVAVDGVEVGSWAGACTSRGQVVIDVSGSRDIARGGSERGVRVSAWTTSETVNGYGGVGTTASCEEWRTVPTVSYRKPRTPKDFSVWRVSDGAADMSWRGDYTGMDGAYPWAQVHIDRRTDEGGWTRVADLGWDATRWRDGGISAGHRYDYRICATGAGGQSDWVESPQYVYTTPRAPSNVQASRVSDGQARVTWQNTAASAVSRKNNLVERRTDEDGWVQVATLGNTAGNYTDNAIEPNHRYQYRVRAYNGLYSGYSESGHIYTTPARPNAVRLSKIGGTKVRIEVESGSRWAEQFMCQLSVNGGEWGAEFGMDLTSERDAGGGEVRARVRARRGDLRSAYTESAAVTTIVAPNAPTLGGLKAVYAIPATVGVTWTRNHPDGTAQTAAQVEVADPKGKVEVIDVAGESSVDVAAALEGRYRVRARTKGLAEDWGAWSAYAAFDAAYAPRVTISAPASDSDVAEVVPIPIRWDVIDSTGVSTQTLRVAGEDGSTLHSVELEGSARSYDLGPKTYMPDNGALMTVEVTVHGGSTLTATARRAFSTAYAAPAGPTIKIDYTPEFAAEITVIFGGDEWAVRDMELVGPFHMVQSDGVPVPSGMGVDGRTVDMHAVAPTSTVSVTRVTPDGKRWLVADEMQDRGITIDPLPPLGVDFSYLVTAYSESGTATTVEVPAHVVASAMALNYGRAASGFIALRYDVEWGRDTETSTSFMDFADGGEAGGLPIAYTTGSVKSTGTIDATVIGDAERAELEDMAARFPVAWVRDPHGRRALCATSLSVTGRVPRNVAGVSLSLTETQWREAWDG